MGGEIGALPLILVLHPPTDTIESINSPHPLSETYSSINSWQRPDLTIISLCWVHTRSVLHLVSLFALWCTELQSIDIYLNSYLIVLALRELTSSNMIQMSNTLWEYRLFRAVKDESNFFRVPPSSTGGVPILKPENSSVVGLQTDMKTGFLQTISEFVKAKSSVNGNW